MPILELPLRAVAGTKPQSAKVSKLLFTNWVSTWLRNNIKYAPRSSHTNPLGNFEAFAGKALKSKHPAWTLSDDSGQYAMSEIAAAHWVHTALVALNTKRKDFAGWFEHFGYELVLPKKHVSPPLLEVKFEGKPFLVAAVKGKPKQMIYDVDWGPQSVDALDAAGKKALAAAAKSGKCACQLCK